MAEQIVKVSMTVKQYNALKAVLRFDIGTRTADELRTVLKDCGYNIMPTDDEERFPMSLALVRKDLLGAI